MPPPVHQNTAGLPFLFSAANLCLLFLLSGCSIAMALHGHPEPNFDNIQVGATNQEVEFEFGTPASNRQLENGNIEETFKYEMANSPNPGRATMYGYIDLATIGLAEPILTLIELFQGHDEETTVVFNSDNRVVDITGYKPPPPSPALITAEESQRKYTKSNFRINASRSEALAGDSPEGLVMSVDAKVKELAHRLSTHLKDHKVGRIAVLPVRDTLGNESQALGSYFTEKLTAKLHEENVARIVERSQLARVTQELYLTHTGGFEEDSAMKIGNLLGVEAVVTTLYADVGQSSIEVNSKVVHVETGEILGVGTMALPRGAVERLLPR
jgi:curli production assembly/transport component CsgG